MFPNNLFYFCFVLCFVLGTYYVIVFLHEYVHVTVLNLLLNLFIFVSNYKKSREKDVFINSRVIFYKTWIYPLIPNKPSLNESTY